MNRLLPAIFVIQKMVLVLSYWFHRAFTPRSRRDSIDWVVGVAEIASMVHQIAGALPRSFSVSLSHSAFYSFPYDYTLGVGMSQRRRSWKKLMAAPILLGRLMVEARGFLYVASAGFLLESLDEREFEFRYLSKKGRRIATYWCGSEIRSPHLMKEMQESMGLPNIFTYIGQVSPELKTQAHEDVLRRRAAAANRYADVMFDVPTDQRSYLEGHREPFFYLVPPERFTSDPGKFDDLSHLVVTHATSSPIIKGTQLVRAAVAKLASEGYTFEYVELIRVDHEQVARQLQQSHIALNQFYGFTTTVFGAEAMAARCAVLTSADETIETSLAPGSNAASLVTRHWQVYDNLKLLLDNPERIQPLADAAHTWALRFASADGTGPVLQGILDSVLDGSYDKQARAQLTTAQLHGVEPTGNTTPKEADQ